jgi:hypothetical protein
LVAQIGAISVAYLTIKKDAGIRPLDPNTLMLMVLLICRSPKSREADDPKCVILERVTSKESSARKILDATPISVSTRTPNPARKR